MTARLLQMILTKIYKWYTTGLFNEKLILAQTLLNKLKKSSLVMKQKKSLILPYCLIMRKLLN